jgi:thiamine pyrophosphate-dependent acetolactate synthase large subunit-like protein
MGLASSIGLGLALANPAQRVVVLDGDGSLLMNLGSLATIGWIRPSNLVIIVLDNALYATTGGQDTATAHGANLAATAAALRVPDTASARDEAGLDQILNRVDAAAGPWLIVAEVAENETNARPPLDCVFIKQRFMAAIGSTETATTGG